MQNIVTGNDFTLIVDARRQETASQRFDLRVLERLEIYLVMAGRAKILQSYTLDELGRAVIEVGGDALPVGVWGVELVGTYQMANVRSTNAKAFKIVDGLNQLGLSGDSIEIVVEVNVLSNAEATRPYVDAAIADHDADVTSHSDIRTALAQKVSDIKVDGISIVDGNKVANLDSDDFGKVDDVKVNGVSVVSNKEAAITMPTKVSDLANDSQFTTKSYVDGEVAQAGHVDDVQVNGTSVVSGKVASVTMPTKVSDLTNDSDYRNTTQVAQQINTAISASEINDAEATVDNNVGTPSADVVKVGNKLYFDFYNLKGEPLTFADLTPQQKEELRGAQGESAVFDPDTGNILAILHNTKGYDDANAMTQKAVTEELMYGEVTFDISGYSVKGGVYLRSSDNKWRTDGGSNNACLIIPVTPGWVIKAVGADNGSGGVYTPQVVFLKTNTYSNGASAASQYAGGVSSYPSWASGETKIVPDDAAYMYVRTKTSGNNVKPTLYKIVSVKEKVMAMDGSIGEQADDIATIAAQLMIETDVPEYRWGKISSKGYSSNGATETNKITKEYVFDTNDVTGVTAKLPANSGLKFAVYTITGSTFEALSGGWVTEDYSFVPVSGTKYVLRISPNVANVTREAMEAINPSLYPFFFVEYGTARRIDNMDARIRAVEGKTYGYHRTYQNITPLLTFEHKTISAQGIEESQTALLAKLPNVGNVEVKMNKPTGGFSVWKKTGNTITCLQSYTHYQHRYTGDYSSDYYVMVEAETGETLDNSIVLVYVYGDEGRVYNYASPSWAIGKSIAFVGDSIVQGRFPKNGSESVNLCMDKPWPNLVAEILGCESYKNFAIGGATVYDVDWKSMQRNASLVSGYDIVFVCGGTNDYGSKTTEENFVAAYGSMLETLMTNNTKVIAVTPVHRTKAVTNPVMGLSGYAADVIEVAEAKNVPIIDMLTLTNTDEFDAHLADGLHPDEVGQIMIADILLEEIKGL